jgi:hypothetical protein
MIYPFEHNERMNKPKHNQWFERLLTFQKIFGLTYRGYGLNAKKRLFRLKKFLICSYEIIVTILIFYLLWTIGTGSEDVKLKIKIETSKKSLLTFLIVLSSFAAIVQQVVNKLTFFLNGPQLLSTIHSFRYYLKPMPLWSKVKICLFITIYCSLTISGFIFYFNDFNSILRDLKENKFQIFFYIFCGLYSGLSHTSIVTLMTFTSDLVRREINGYLLGIKNNGNTGFIFK